MDGPASGAINLDHERRLLDLEREFGKRGRVTVLEQQLDTLRPTVDEFLLAKRVTAGVNAHLEEQSAAGFTRWQRIGISAAIATSVGSFILALVQAWPG